MFFLFFHPILHYENDESERKKFQGKKIINTYSYDFSPWTSHPVAPFTEQDHHHHFHGRFIDSILK